MSGRDHDWSLPYVGAHKHSANHRDAIEASDLCGCFHCLATFPPTRIAEWIDGDGERGTTALCPSCGVDAVVGSASGIAITRDLLTTMRLYWFR
jgi:hypothetical protein